MIIILNMIISNLNYNMLKVFYILGKTNSLSKASENLGISQPSISYTLNKLEETFKVKLFIRGYKGVKFTKIGKEIFLKIESAYSHLKEIQTLVKEYNGEMDLHLSVGISAHVYSMVENQFVKFIKKYKNITLKIIDSRTNEFIRMLKHGDIDIIIDIEPAKFINTDANIQYIKEIPMCFACSVNNYAKYKNLQSLNEIQNEKCLVPINGSGGRNALESNLLKMGVRFSNIMEVQTTTMMLSLIKKGIGIGYVYRSTVQPFEDRNEIKVLDINDSLDAVTLCAVYKNKFNNIIEAFINELKN